MVLGLINYGEEKNPYDSWQTALNNAISRRFTRAQAEEQEAKNPYVGQRELEALLMDRLKNKYYGPNIESEIGLRGAQANLANTEAGFMPTKYDIEKMNAISRQKELGSRNSNAFRLWAQTSQGQAAIARDPRLAEAVYNAIQENAGNYGYTGENYQQTASQNYQSPQVSQPSQPNVRELPPSNAPFNYSGVVQAPVNPQQEVQQEADQHVNQSYGQRQSHDEMIRSIQKAAADSYERYNLPADSKKRLVAGNRFKSTIPLVTADFKLAKEYFSPEGKIQLAYDEKAPLWQQNANERLQAYRRFKQDIEQLNLQGAFLEGVPADQISRGEYKRIWDIPMFFNSPEMAEDLLNNGITLGLTADEANRASLSELTGMSPARQPSQVRYGNDNKSNNNSSNAIKWVRDPVTHKLVRASK